VGLPCQKEAGRRAALRRWAERSGRVWAMRGEERRRAEWAACWAERGERPAGLGLSERNGPACGIWVGFSRAVWAGPGWGFGLAGFHSFSLIFLSFSFLLKQTNSNKTKLFEFKFKFESNPNTQTIKTMHRHECINKVNPMINF